MSIDYLVEKVKPFYTLILLALISSTFLALWWLFALEKDHLPIKILSKQNTQTGATLEALEGVSGAVVGSKSGKKYYFPWCSTAKRMKPENQVKFDSIELAKKAGFTPGGNCKGLI